MSSEPRRLFSDEEVAKVVAKAPPWDDGPDTSAFERMAIDLRNARARIADLQGEMWGRYNRIRDLEAERDALAGQVAALRERVGAFLDAHDVNAGIGSPTSPETVKAEAWAIAKLAEALASTESVAREWTAERDTAQRHAVRLREAAGLALPLVSGWTGLPKDYREQMEAGRNALAAALAATSEDCARWSRELAGAAPMDSDGEGK